MMTPKLFIVFIICIALSACTTHPQAERASNLLADEIFSRPKQTINVADVFALDDNMRAYLQRKLPDTTKPFNPAQEPHDPNIRKILVDALFDGNQLRLDYDAAITRNASETFHARAGNCLSLTIMAAAMARELGLTVYFQQVNSNQVWGRQDDLQIAIGHVNLVVGERIPTIRSRLGENALHTIDFMRFSENQILPTTLVSEQTILAMFMNNRAAETLAAGDIQQAYWFAREAVTQAPTFLPAYITLGVIYRRHGALRRAEETLAYVLQREPSNTHAISNLITILQAGDRRDEAVLWQQRLAAAQPIAPFANLDLGKRAIEAGDYRAARDFFLKELNRGTGGNSHEVHFWLANAYYRLGDFSQTKNHLDLAVDFSPTRKDRDLYAAKRDVLAAERKRVTYQ